ncbi:MAG: hypothetical protein LBC18_05585, partial [Opitutaceae bacterium]|nr:hypothetical protein [Opitutaceae bacterium]
MPANEISIALYFKSNVAPILGEAGKRLANFRDTLAKGQKAAADFNKTISNGDVALRKWASAAGTF